MAVRIIIRKKIMIAIIIINESNSNKRKYKNNRNCSIIKILMME
jgi:hypothetical protein